MRRICMVLAAMLVAASPALAASTPEGLAPELSRAARTGNNAAFMAAMSAGTRRAMAQASAARARLDRAQQDFDAALKDRFGATPGGGGGTPVARTGVSGLVGIDLIGIERRTPHGGVLRLRILSSGPPERTITTEYALPAVVEDGQWELNLAAAQRDILRALPALAGCV